MIQKKKKLFFLLCKTWKVDEEQLHEWFKKRASAEAEKEREEIRVRFRVNGKTYRVREGSIIYKAFGVLIVAAMVTAIGLMNSWELGLL